MLDRNQLKDILHLPGISRGQQILVCLAVAPGGPRSVAEIRDLAVGAGLTAAKGWNISDILGSLTGVAVRTASGWELNGAGEAQVARIAGVPQTPIVVSTLRSQLGAIPSPDIRNFVEEAVGCAERGYFRAAVVLSWVGALAVLYDHVVAKQLSLFNVEARRRDAKWRDAKTADDLARMGEYQFLQILEAISVIGKSVKSELESCLKLRNGCGHPNSLKVAEHRVSSHIETLLLNVFARF